nr:hypothetical protein [Polyangiaceae bacterium]
VARGNPSASPRRDVAPRLAVLRDAADVGRRADAFPLDRRAGAVSFANASALERPCGEGRVGGLARAARVRRDACASFGGRAAAAGAFLGARASAFLSRDGAGRATPALASPFAQTALGVPPPPGVFEPASSPTGASRTMPFNTVSSSVPLDSSSPRSFQIRTAWLAVATVMLVGVATFGALSLRGAKLSGNADVVSSTSSLSASPSAKVVPVRAPPTPPSENAVPSSALPPTPPSAKAEPPAASEPLRGATPTVPSQAAAASPMPSTAGRAAGVEKRAESSDGKKALLRELSPNRQGNPPAEKRPDAKKPDEKKTEGADAAGGPRPPPAPAPAEPTPSKGMYERR